jgi:cellobiose phosphorylase
MLTQRLLFSAHAECEHTLGATDQFCVQLNLNGQVLSASAGDILLSRTLGNPLEGGLGRMFLRVYIGGSVELYALLGSTTSLSNFACDGEVAQWSGEMAGCLVQLTLRVDVEASTLLWDVTVANESAESVRIDTVWVQDVGLASRGALLSNEAYTAHYLDESVIQDISCGPVLSFRQNLQQAGKNPWLMAACLSGAASYATDAFEVYGNGYRCGEGASGLERESLTNRCYQYEFSCAALQANPVDLDAAGSTRFSYAAAYVADHPEASSMTDLSVLERMRTLSEQSFGASVELQPLPVLNWIARAEPVHGRDLSQSELQDLFPSKWRHTESREGAVMSFFCDTDTHVVTRAKEALIERPHGTILVGNAGTDSMREVMATTVYMYGVFSAQTVYGNTSFHKMNSLPREPLGLSRASGMRIYFESEAGWKVLGTPSVFEMKRDACRWVYALGAGTITVRVALDAGRDAFTVSTETTTGARRFIITNELIMGAAESELNASLDVDLSARALTLSDAGQSMPTERGIQLAFGVGWTDSAEMEAIGGSELLGAAGDDSLLVMQTQPTERFELAVAASLKGAADVAEKLKSVGSESDANYWTRFNRGLDCSRDVGPVARLSDALRWYSHNALIHYASPHGLEQYTGAAWGTRDACQGPFEYFIAQQYHELARSILLKIFGSQYEDTGDWPQWFMHDEYFDIAQHHSHGDIVVWPLKALALYLSCTGDLAVLDAEAPYLTADNKPADFADSIAGHVEKALDRIEQEFILDTALIRYGGGDWDDSLQPASSDLAARLVSGWTVALLAQSLAELAVTLDDSALKTRVSILSARVRADFRRYVLIDGVVAGFLLYDENLKTAEPLLHPNDTLTGIYNRLIPMTRSIIAGLLTRKEADLQMQRISDHLKHPDGVRLMDRPAPYSGGLETFFKRAESAANFGREIGLQYVHAHIRYAEALAKLGDGDSFLKALLTICPISIEKTVPNAEMRQSNMYFSSSDAAFLNRADAAENFDKLRDGSISVKGGWRLYSSGPGLYSGLVIRQFFGLRELADAWVFDPVLPMELDGIVLTWELCGKTVKIEYQVKSACAGPKTVQCAGGSLEATRESNPYREGGLVLEKSVLEAALASDSRIIVSL